MGTGVGEAMLIGAAVGATAGGAGAAIQGGDPLQGALLGGAMGAAGGGFSAIPGATTGAVSGASTGAATGATTGASTGAATGASTGAATTFVPSSTGLMALPGEAGIAALPSATGAGATSPFVTSSTGLSVLPGEAGTAALSPSTVAPKPNIFGYLPGEKGFISNTGLATIGGTSLLGGLMQAERDEFGIPATEDYESTFDPSKFVRSTPTYAPESVYRPEYRDYTTAAEGGIVQLANGGPVERMSMMNTAMNPQGGLYPQGMIDKTQYATPTQRPVSAELMMDAPAYERSNPMLMNEGGIANIVEAAKAQGLTLDAYQNIYGRGNAIIEMEKRLKEGKSMADGGISSLGGYSDGGRMLKGPGDGMSDSIPGVIANKQPARLADGEFVVPADVVSHLGNGSTDAGAKQLYAMMDKVRKARTGKKKQAPAVKANRYMPA
jgi:hypothetical protein